MLVSKTTCFGGLVSLVQVPRVEESNVGHKPLTPQGKAPNSKLLPTCVSPQEVGFLVRPHLCLSCWSRCSPFIPRCGGSWSASSQFFFRGNYSTCNNRFEIPMGGGESRLFLYLHLEPPMFYLLNLYWQLIYN